jgi:hypothetical protein
MDCRVAGRMSQIDLPPGGSDPILHMLGDETATMTLRNWFMNISIA